MNKLVFIQNDRPVTDSLTVAESFEKRHDNVLKDIRELGCSEEFRLLNFEESTYINQQNKEMPKYYITEQGFTLLVMGYTGQKAMQFKEKYIMEFHRMREEIQKQKLPATLEDLIIMQAQSVKEIKARVASLEEKTKIANHRIDNLDAVDTIGDLQQRLNSMIRKLAQQEGVLYSSAWKMFTQAYNTAYRTNLKLALSNYANTHQLKKLTKPEYLSRTGKLEDAIRVADKLLNKVS
jgi:Rha family phage regulatory protein